MIEIGTPDGGVARFPDGTPDTTIKAAMRKAFGGPQDQPRLEWSDVPGQALQNAPESALNFGKAMVQPVIHPVDTLQALVDLPTGAIREGTRAILPESTFNNVDEYLFGPKDVADRASQRATAVANFYKDRYFSGADGFKNALATDPIGVLADFATVFTGGELTAARIAGETSNVTRTLGAVARATDPLTPFRAAKNAVFPQSPEQAVNRAMPGIDQRTLDAANRLRIDAQQRGINLSWPEAIQQASGGATRLGDLQRVVENSEGGGATMRQFYADQPAQVDAAARQQFEDIAPQPMIPERLGPRVQQAAEGDIDAVRRGINRQTRPLYQAAENQVLPPNHPALSDPAFLEAVRTVRGDPVIGPTLAHLPDNSIGVIDAVQKELKARATALETPGSKEGLNPQRAALTREARRQATNAARNASPEYDAAVQYQRQLRDDYLNPLEEGPTGKTSRTTDVGAQTQALFPNKPQAQSEIGTARAIRGISSRDPAAAEGIVRQHLETAFNEASQRIQSGENPAGGAKFAAVIAGNPQQRANLVAALRALPNGAVLWRGFNRFLDIMEATGKRPAPNSMTTFNTQIQKELERGGAVGEVASIAASPQKALTYIKDRYAQYRLGRGTAELARLFTEGNLQDFQRILRLAPGSPQAIGILVRLIGQTSVTATEAVPE